MLSFSTILAATVPVFLIIGAGFFTQKKGWLGEDHEFAIMRLTLNLFVPCLVLTTIPGSPALSKLSTAFWTAGFGFGSIVAGFALSAVIGWLAGLRKGLGLRTFTLSAGIQNYGYLPIPIMGELFPGETGLIGMVFVFGVGVEFAMWSAGLMILTGKASWRSIANVPFLAVIAALILNYSTAHRWIPGPVQASLEMLGRCAIPLSIFMIGAIMGRYFSREVLRDAWRVGLSSVTARMLLLAGLILAGAVCLPAPEDLRKLAVIQAAMPAAVFPIVLARVYGGSPVVAIQVVLATSLVSLFSAPFVIAIGLRLL